jgi:hypothetical protein
VNPSADTPETPGEPRAPQAPKLPAAGESPVPPALTPRLQEEFKRLDAIEARQDQTAYRLKVVAGALALLFAVSILVETLAVRQAVDRASKAAALSAQRARQARRAVAGKRTTLYRLFPASLTGYVTKSRQMVPGSSESAEALYEPEDMNLQLARPTTVYGLITQFASPADAESHIQKELEKFPTDRATVMIFDAVGVSGYSADRNQYAIFIAQGNLAVMVKALFTQSDPVDKGTILKDHGTHIAEEVVKRIREVKSGVVEDTGEETGTQ